MMTATRNSDAEECYLIRRGRWLVAYTLSEEEYQALRDLEDVLLEPDRQGEASVLTRPRGGPRPRS